MSWVKLVSLQRLVGTTFLLSAAVSPRRAASLVVEGSRPRCRSSGHTRILMTKTAAPPGGPAADAASGVWDAEAGVWVGDRAAGQEGSVPSPLWIFGYGSLCWRPEESFAGFERFNGEVVGWKRLFAQKSMDHRGTPEFPGLVATLVSDADLEALGERSAGDPPSRTHGVAYLVPDNKAEEVLAGLDFREKGGYTRATVNVLPAGGEGGEKEAATSFEDTKAVPTPALLYTATTSNPNFHLPSIDEAADTIASAVGPSGPNDEYLFSLSQYLEKVGTPDPHLIELSDMVRSRIKARA
ncbi:unnamed protein product [Ectocarpus fasciculatus]